MSMRDYSKPIRPPRSSKSIKDTPGYLMKIVQALSISQDNTERDRQKEMLEKEFSENDKALWRLIKLRQEELANSQQAFTKTAATLAALISKCADMKEKLNRCKTLLHCRQDELKRLWLEVVEHKRVMSMLKEIENVISVPERIEAFLKANMYLEATQLLASSILLFEGSLEGIDALKELKTELYTKREELHQILVAELHTILYLSASNHILKQFKRHGSGRMRHNDIGAMFKNFDAAQKQPLNKNPQSNDMPISLAYSAWTEDSFPDTEENTQSSISKLIECLALLHRIPETVEILKEKCQYELLAIIRRTGQHVSDTCQNVPYNNYDRSYLGSEQNKEQQYSLFDLLELIFEQFKIVLRNHKYLLTTLEKRKKTFTVSKGQTIYEMADIWSIVQAVLEIFVGDYVDIHNSSAQAPTSATFSNVPSAVDISSYFHRKRNAKVKTYSLFKFDSSSHAISMKTYLQEQRDALKEKGEMDAFDPEMQVFICSPAIKNIIIIYKPLTKFITEVAEELKMESGETGPLQNFISRCVKVFIGQITLEVNHVIEMYSKSVTTWKVVSDADELKKIGVSTCLLHSAVYVDSTVKELNDLITTLPQHSAHLLNIVCNMLQNYRDCCQNEYNILIQQNYPDVRIISSSWAKDKDISRLLRSLPNWSNLKEKDCSEFEESPEEIRLRNKKESEILIANLTGDILISHLEILSDLNCLKNLALMHESMQWLGSNLVSYANSLPKCPYSTSVMNLQTMEEDEPGSVPDPIIESLLRLANDFINIADTCLLLLHLEIRVHCFYYLQPLTAQGIYAARLDNQEPDPEIIKLNMDLSKIDEILQPILKPSNIKYIFEGLGELIATILINSTNKIKRINENGIKKINRNIFALQQNLTGITMLREVALDRARQYFDLLNYSPEEILNLILENGPQFQELEYTAVFHVLQRIQPDNDSALDSHLERLHQILNEVAVSV